VGDPGSRATAPNGRGRDARGVAFQRMLIDERGMGSERPGLGAPDGRRTPYGVPQDDDVRHRRPGRGSAPVAPIPVVMRARTGVRVVPAAGTDAARTVGTTVVAPAVPSLAARAMAGVSRLPLAAP